MGGAVSSGKNNEELVDNLCHEGYIHEPDIEKVFRQIDRADYMVFQDEDSCLEAYEDHAWRKGTLHLSAPCIYTRAMEALKLKKGVSFLNIGSGTGYFSTMAGQLIGPYGINHGIELYQQNVDYAQTKQTEFLEDSPWYNPVEYCEPLFVIGNGLLLSPGNILYDRIYCGAACPPEHAKLMKNMLSIGGILVMPNENQLESICRVSAEQWESEVVLPSVSFAPLILPSQESVKDLAALEIAVEPHSLKQLCRLDILRQLGRQKYHRVSELPLPTHLKTLDNSILVVLIAAAIIGKKTNSVPTIAGEITRLDYVSHYREWGPPPTPVKILCPIDRSEASSTSSQDDASCAKGGKGLTKDNEGGAPLAGLEKNGFKRKRRNDNSNSDSDGASMPQGRSGQPFAQAMNVNGRRVLLLNINGVYLQVPIDRALNRAFVDNSSDEELDNGSEGDPAINHTDESDTDFEDVQTSSDHEQESYASLEDREAEDMEQIQNKPDQAEAVMDHIVSTPGQEAVMDHIESTPGQEAVTDHIESTPGQAEEGMDHIVSTPGQEAVMDQDLTEPVEVMDHTIQSSLDCAEPEVADS